MASRCLLESVGMIPVRSANGRVKYAGRKGPRFLDAKTDLLSHLQSVSWGHSMRVLGGQCITLREINAYRGSGIPEATNIETQA